MDTVKRYANGLRLIISPDSSLSVSFGIGVGTGSQNETPENNGISHFIEHMSFKGTENFTYFDIANKLDLLGAAYNAYTSDGTTFFYAHTIKESMEKSFQILSELVVRSIYPENELEKEKGVVLEEIKMNEDSPDDVCLEKCLEGYYGKAGHGLSVLGPSKNIKRFTRQDIIDYLDKYYVAENIVITFVGNITMDEADYLVSKYVNPYIRISKKAISAIHNTENLGGHIYKEKDIEQSHLCLAIKSFSIFDDNKLKSDMANNILGGGMSCRLFQKIREEMSLAYNVYSSPYRFSDSGLIYFYAAVGQDSVEKTANAILNEIKIFANEGITDEEFEKTAIQFKVDVVFSMEKSQSRLMSLTKQMLYKNELLDYNKRIDDINKITKKDLNDIVSEYKVDKFATAVVGKNAKALII